MKSGACSYQLFQTTVSAERTLHWKTTPGAQDDKTILSHVLWSQICHSVALTDF